MRNALISIIMPSLNVAKYMDQCLASVVSQTLKEIEIVCVDAGSTDGTLEIIQKYADDDNRIKVINSPIKSYGYQMNLGLKLAVGEYIGIVETDDYIDCEMFQKLYEMAKKQDVDFVKGGYIGFVSDTHVVERRYVDIIDKQLLNKRIDLTRNRKAGAYMPEHIWSGIYKRSFLEKWGIRFNETSGASYQDESFYLLVGMLADHCVYMEDVYYHYRMDNKKSSVKSSGKIECIIDEFIYLKSKLEACGQYNVRIKEILDRSKLVAYAWNYHRLNAEGRLVFLKLIEGEMKKYLESSMQWEFSGDEKDVIELLTNPNLIEVDLQKEQMEQDKLLRFVNRCKSGEKFHVVGAGQIFDSLVDLEKILDIRFISSVSDNAKNMQGKEKNGLIIKPVENAVQEDMSGNWIIANKKYAAEINSQLVAYGVKAENILHIDTVISLELFWMLR